MINAQTKLFGLLGNPVGHSLSPFMQNIFLEQCGVNGVYLAFAVAPDKVGDALRGMFALGVQGANVTIPYKEAVIPYLCGMSKAAQACNAVNTLIYTEKGYYGDNTDGAGLLAALAREHDWRPEGRKILLVGAGGAAKGVSVAMALQGAAEICIANRSGAHAEALAEQIEKLGNVKVTAIPLEQLQREELYSQYHTIVNTTSLGMSPHVERMIPLRAELLGAEHLVVDLVYNPLETKLLRTAKEHGAKTASGLGMLLYQGALAFEAWTGKGVDPELVRQQLIAQLSGLAQ